MRIKNTQLLIIGFIFVGLIVLSLYFLLPFFSKKSSAVPQNISMTNETKSANSLDVSLYPHTSWKKIEKNLHDEDGINQIMGILENYDYIAIPFTQGTFYQAQSPIEYNTLESYYADVLEKAGWTSEKLQFDTFDLQNLVADAPCEGVMGFIGYKDNAVKIISIQHKLLSCGSLGSPDATPYSADQKTFAEYTIFVSDPKPLKEVEEYIQTNSQSDL